ncbi:threonine-phosphate decarboxylase [Pontivivens ytuae]|uniref:Aminotransferase n=1 Tax=Pontivivens ytuae TaxID=2789856 RepID=A0A7S9LQB0_9RHOB|nr:threonine-phosphate decarboxylase [Pontivivens ytuae]QPH52770.1 pyridoxal phosphate-dependent class II aminotransferase [Pontivivens ytuae]
MILPEREHGGNLDAAIRQFGGAPTDWLDLSTGINPVPYPLPPLAPELWTRLPDRSAFAAVEAAARAFWSVPDGAEVVIAPGASALIAAMPDLAGEGAVEVLSPTYNEHAAAFAGRGRPVREVVQAGDDPVALRVVVHPNNPDGRVYGAEVLEGAAITVVDESFADVATTSFVDRTATPGCVVLKSFGKFWGLAGLRLGFAICMPEHAAILRARLGPWAASGPALAVAAQALNDPGWAEQARARLAVDARRLDAIMGSERLVGGCDLFRLYAFDDAAAVQQQLARRHIWTRTFGYDPRWLRLGLPAGDRDFDRLAEAMA